MELSVFIVSLVSGSTVNSILLSRKITESVAVAHRWNFASRVSSTEDDLIPWQPNRIKNTGRDVSRFAYSRPVHVTVVLMP